MEIYLLHHIHELPSGEEEVKFIGAYSSAEVAELATKRAKVLPGFQDHVEGFFTWIPNVEK
jgi:hypothetical protein